MQELLLCGEYSCNPEFLMMDTGFQWVVSDKALVQARLLRRAQKNSMQPSRLLSFSELSSFSQMFDHSVLIASRSLSSHTQYIFLHGNICLNQTGKKRQIWHSLPTGQPAQPTNPSTSAQDKWDPCSPTYCRTLIFLPQRQTFTLSTFRLSDESQL